jgi:hypothetical protein
MRHLKETALRPQPRRRTSTILLSAIAAAALGAAGCSTVSNEIAVQTPATVAPDAGAAPILDVYGKFMAAYVHAYNTANPKYGPFLSLGGGNGGGIGGQLSQAIANGVTATGTPNWSDPSVQYVDGNQTIASVTFCFSPGTWKTIDAQNGRLEADPSRVLPPTPPSAAPSSSASQSSDSAPGSSAHPPHPIYAGDVAGAYTVLMLLNRDARGHWLVAQTNAQPDRPCSSPSASASAP